MYKLLKRVGVLGIAPLILLVMSGCGWEPLRRSPVPTPDGQPPDTPVVLKAEIIYDCEGCVVSQSESKTGEAPLPANFVGKVTLPDPSNENVIYWGWDFGDGSSAEGEQVEHTFQNPGTYRIKLRVITSKGNETRDQVMIIVYPKTAPAENVKHEIEEGDLCKFERIMPATIYKGIPFKVQVIITTKQPVQVLQWEDNVWFPEFRLKQEPSGVWLMIDTGQRISLEYEGELWQPPTAEKVWMSGIVSCNAGGLGDSEELEMRTNFDDIVL